MLTGVTHMQSECGFGRIARGCEQIQISIWETRTAVMETSGLQYLKTLYLPSIAAMRDGDSLSELIRLIGDAALEPSLWSDFQRDAANLLDCHMAMLKVVSRDVAQDSLTLAHGIPEPQLEVLTSRCESEDYWYNGMVRLPSRSVVLGSELIHRREMEKTRYYRELGFAMDAEFMLGATVENRPERVSMVCFVRGRDRGDFGDGERALLRQLVPHLARSFEIRSRLNEERRLGQSLREAMNGVPYGIVIVDTQKSVLFVNRTGERVLEERDGLSLRQQALCAYQFEQSLALDRALESACDGAAEDPELMRVDRLSGRLPYQVLVRRLPSESECLVEIHDPDREPAYSGRALKVVYGLTEVEAKLCLLAFRGLSNHQIADELAISHNTVKTHLKRIFEKCGVHSKVQLVKLMALAPR